MTDRVDLSETDDAAGNEYIWLPYALWWGWNYAGEGKGMRKVGGRVTHGETSVNVLASDLDLVDEGGLVISAHPDKWSILRLLSFEDDRTRGDGVVDDASLAASNVLLTYSWWFVGDGVYKRGPTDLNFLYGDGSVARFNDVTWDEPDREGGRMVKMSWVPNSPGAHLPARRVHLPRN